MRWLILAAVVLAAAGPYRPPLAVVQSHDRDYAANRPWLDHTCYDDDHTYDFYAAGWLAPGQTWTHTPPLAVCADKIVKARAWHKAGTFALGLRDYMDRAIPERVTDERRYTFHRSCNTDLDWQTVQAYGNEAGEPFYPVVWSVTNTGSRDAYVEATGMIGEPPWQGGEGTYTDCIEP